MDVGSQLHVQTRIPMGQSPLYPWDSRLGLDAEIRRGKYEPRSSNKKFYVVPGSTWFVTVLDVVLVVNIQLEFKLVRNMSPQPPVTSR
jgi:hypothetical protein